MVLYIKAALVLELSPNAIRQLRKNKESFVAHTSQDLATATERRKW